MQQISQTVDSTDNDTKQSRPVHPYHSAQTLRDDTSIIIRSACPNDEPLLVQFQQSLSQGSVYTRYFSYLPLERRTTHERLAKDCLDDKEQITLVAECQEGNPQRPCIRGIAQLMHEPATNQGEFSIAVCDTMQGKGLGTLLMQCLEEVGTERGMREIIGYILPENYAMLAVCKKLGYVIARDKNMNVMKAVKHV